MSFFLFFDRSLSKLFARFLKIANYLFIFFDGCVGSAVFVIDASDLIDNTPMSCSYVPEIPYRVFRIIGVKWLCSCTIEI